MLTQRAEMAALQPRPMYLNRPRQPKTMLRGEYADLLRQSATRTNTRDRAARAALREQQDTARGFTRTVPASGPGRRRAKALRNRQAVTLGPVG
jgi:hypothetical protein